MPITPFLEGKVFEPGVRAASRITGVNRGTVAALALKVGHGCAELHDRMMVGLRVSRLELDELWAFVGKKQKRVIPKDIAVKGDQYTFVGLAASSRAIVSYRTGKRSDATTDDFIQDIRDRVIGSPEISTDGFTPYQPAIRDAFRNSAHGVIVKTYAVTDLRKDASHRYSPAAVVAVSREVMNGVPARLPSRYSAHKWLQQEDRKPLRRIEFIRCLLQSLPCAPAQHASDGAWNR